MGEPASNGHPHANGSGASTFSLKFAGSSKPRVAKGAAFGGKEEEKRELIVGLSGTTLFPVSTYVPSTSHIYQGYG